VKALFEGFDQQFREGLREVSLNPWRIGTIARAALAFFHIERPRRLILTQRSA
jgi:hypothetical protein